jgi:large subunit ribosomal protein L10
LAITKEEKRDVVKEYTEWLKRSQALIVTEYKGLPMKDIDSLRARLRENGGEFHVVKNTLGRRALEDAGYQVKEDMFEGSTAVGFAFEDAPAVAKALADFARTSEFLKIKGGYLGDRVISTADVTALAEMPPLPVMRARLLGMISAPASQLARTLAEPGRSLAAVFKAFADRSSEPQAQPEPAA